MGITDKDIGSQQVAEIIQHENEYWSEVFDQARGQDKADKLFSSYWWENYYQEIIQYIKTSTDFKSNWKILEAGSGSGKSSILLGKKIDRTFLDISDKALEFASLLANKFQVQNIKYVQGNILQMPFDSRSFDLVWNIGEIEHYEKEQIKAIFSEMIRTTKNGGYLAVGVPNFWTGATLKAWLLKQPLFKFIQGYRLDSEKFYSLSELCDLITQASIEQGRVIQSQEITYFGNPLIMEAPAWLINSIGKFIARIFPKTKFLTFITIKIN